MRYSAVFFPSATDEDLRTDVAICGGKNIHIFRHDHLVLFEGDVVVANKVRGLGYIKPESVQVDTRPRLIRVA